MERYIKTLKFERAWRFSLAGAIARISFSSTVLALLYTLRHIYGSWAMAGIISGSMLIISSTVLPFTAYLIDRFGQTVIGFLFTYLKVSGMIATIIFCANKAPIQFVALSSFVICFFSVPYGSMVRRRWSHILRDENSKSKIHTAFAIENTIDNLIYVIGPILITFTIANVSPELALLIPAASNLIGGTALFIQKSTRPPRNRELADKELTDKKLKTKKSVNKKIAGKKLTFLKQFNLVFVLVLVFSLYGSADILARHIAISENMPQLNGIIISTISAFGIVSSVLYPRINKNGKRGWKFFCLILIIGSALLPATCNNIYLFWANVAILGFALSPIYILADIVITKLPEQKNKTLNFSLVGISNGLGNALGIYIIGFTVESNLVLACTTIAAICILGSAYAIFKFAKR
ncbi:MAG: MFS transporter [Bifidobacteriaceae bacterium]|jgi:MFS family permease|nr:MFS transporter [Bifidobacteriaceae bacterium]